MIKDLKDSRRIHTNFTNTHKEKLAQDFINHEHVNVFVLSRLYWPGVKADSFKLPEEVGKFMDKYTKSYSELKAGRTLELRPTAGTVDLTLELEGREVTVTVPPLTASIIVLFQHKAEWTLDHLTAQLDATATAVRNRLGYWLSMGLVKETSPNVFVLDEHGEATHEKGQEDDEEADNGDNEEHLVLLKFVEGMLKQQKQLPINRIAMMLNMFMTGDQAFKGTPADLKKILDQAVKEGQLGRSGDMYTLP
eukprot:TRINITY_DN8118_c0_g1_i2.p2 TRINITY_DN8118_c0_g1~~TRINITY_DN8118_c0_g1_i2.p2  ORF type:complete len:250 (+),score=93.56 TRINITY_DN8118_c0_g1_i2:1577-2326(+)